jgi:S1-C subfamily serine protease
MDSDLTVDPDGVQRSNHDDVRAFLENLTGPARGQITWLSSDRSNVFIGPDRVLQVGPDGGTTSPSSTRAQLLWSGETYEIEAMPNSKIWVNGRETGAAHLLHGDMIEFGEDGPMSRFRLCDNTYPTGWPVEEILSDAVAYARTSRRPFGSRLSNAFIDSVRRLLLETTIFFRVSVIVVLIVLTTFVAWQYRSDILLLQSIEEERLRVEAIATALAETRQEALGAEELETLREQLDMQLNTNADRLALLERRLGASARVIAQSTTSVAFLQGAYGLRQIESGRLLRHVLGDDGVPLETPFGKPLVDPEGNGKPIEFQFTGTGFLLKDSGYLVTNRHVALPWTDSERMLAFEMSGLAPEMLALLVFLPGMPAPIDANFLASSKTADLALLSVPALETSDRGLTLAQGEPEIGDEVIVMGFSTGLRALLAQAGSEFLSSLQETGETDFWSVATRLSAQDRIAPLASRGIIAQIANKAVIYDAETTVGGSGGPVLDRYGHVVAVNAAILPEFGGANIGVPVREVLQLLAGLPNN